MCICKEKAEKSHTLIIKRKLTGLVHANKPHTNKTKQTIDKRALTKAREKLTQLITFTLTNIITNTQ